MFSLAEPLCSEQIQREKGLCQEHWDAKFMADKMCLCVHMYVHTDLCVYHAFAWLSSKVGQNYFPFFVPLLILSARKGQDSLKSVYSELHEKNE